MKGTGLCLGAIVSGMRGHWKTFRSFLSFGSTTVKGNLGPMEFLWINIQVLSFRLFKWSFMSGGGLQTIFILFEKNGRSGCRVCSQNHALVKRVKTCIRNILWLNAKK